MPFHVRWIACGARHSLFLEAVGGMVFACGDNSRGQLGHRVEKIKSTKQAMVNQE